MIEDDYPSDDITIPYEDYDSMMEDLRFLDFITNRAALDYNDWYMGCLDEFFDENKDDGLLWYDDDGGFNLTEEVTISKIEYERLLVDRKILYRLYDGGVDDWEWYDKVMEGFDDEG